jgi:aryl-alcohol dehydrogenase-like predicted oxidoreductase
MIVYNPLAGGLLTGKQHRDRPIAGTRFDNNQMYLDRFWHPAYFDAVDEVQKIAQKAGRSMVDLSFNWLLDHTATDVVLIGASKIEQLEQNLEVFGRGPLDSETVVALDQVWQNLRGVTPKYNR